MVALAERQPSLITPRFLTIVFAQMAFGYAVSSFVLLPKFLATALGANATQIGRISALPGLAAVLLTPFVGGWLDRVGRRPLLGTGALIACAYACAWTFVDHVGAASYTLQLASGCAFVMAMNASSTLVSEGAPPERVGQVIGLLGAANVTMGAVAPSVAEPLAAELGWHAAFLLAAVFAALGFLLASRIDEAPRVREPSVPHALHPSHMLADLRQTFAVARRVGRQLAALVTCGAAYGAISTFYQPFVIAQGAKRVSTFFVGFTLAIVCTRVFFGSLGDRLGRRRVAISSFTLYAIAVLAMVELTPQRLLVFGLLLGSAHGVFLPTINALSIERTRPGERGRVLTLVNGGFQLGYMSAVLCFGSIGDRSGYPAVFVLAAGFTALGVALLAFDRERGTMRA